MTDHKEEQSADKPVEQQYFKETVAEKAVCRELCDGDEHDEVCHKVRAEIATLRAQLEDAQKEKHELEVEVRENLWHHGHGTYGDDGEMQCSEGCREWDYKRGDLKILREQAFAARLASAEKKMDYKTRAEAAESRCKVLEGALQQIERGTCGCFSSSDYNWHSERCPKGIARKALGDHQ